MLPKLSDSDKEIISNFYWGKNFDVLRKTEENKDKEQQLQLLISKLKLEALKQLKEKNNKSVNTQVKKQNIQTNISNSEKDINESPKKSKKSTKQYKPLLDYFDKKDHEKVLQIVERFKITNPNYYGVINKKYSGERYEIVKDIKLDKKETSVLNNAKTRINQILELTLDKYNKFINDQIDNKKEIKVEKSKKTPKQYKPLLDYFDKKDHEKVLQIVERFEITNPNYYEVINKKYSGERYEIVKGVKLDRKETFALSNVKARINKILKFTPDKYNKFINNPIDNKEEIKNEQKKKGRKHKPLLDYFDEKDHERVLEIVERFKITNPNYYGVINKKYSGERYEIVTDVKLNKKELDNLVRAREKIAKMLKRKNNISLDNISKNKIQHKEKTKSIEVKNVEQNNKTVDESIKISQTTTSNEITIESINDILKFEPKTESYNILLKAIIKNKKTIFRILSIDDIVDCYIDNLSYFEASDAATIIKIIAMYKTDKIKKIIESSYFKDKLQYLTLREQEYIYLTLISHNNKYLTIETIAEMLEVDKKTLEQYEIMTSDEDVNKLNILFKNI